MKYCGLPPDNPLSHAYKYMHVYTYTHTHAQAHAHSPGMHGSWAHSAQGPAVRESSALYSHTHQAGFAIYMFNHWIRLWEPIETTELKLPGSNCWKTLEKDE